MRFLTLDVGGKRTKWAIFRNGEMAEQGAFPTPDKPEDLAVHLKEMGASVIAVAFAGFAHEGKIAFSPNLPGYQGFPLAEFLSGEISARVILENDANLFTLGEARRGAGRGAKTVLGITLGTGIGGGLVICGKIYRGAGFALEPGHMIVDPEGPPCGCGNHGCLESLIGEGGFCKRFGYASAKEAFEARDEKAWNFYGYWLGLGLANLINILDPDAAVLGGGIARAFGLFEKAMIAAVASRAVEWNKRKTRLAMSELGDGAALWGGYLLAKNPGD